MVIFLRPLTALYLAMFLVGLTIHVTLGHSTTTKSDILCLESEKQALLRFKQDLIDPSNRLFSWVVEEDCCRWVGIHCDNLTGRVKEIKLANHLTGELKGKISPSLLNLKHLIHLDLTNIDFGGVQIPSFMGLFSNLRYLSLNNTRFEGLIPHQLGNLSSLRHLVISNYRGSLYVDNLHWLSSLSLLEYLHLSHVNLNKASDHWSFIINMLPNLKFLYLRFCKLSHIPTLSFVNLTSIIDFDIQGNNFHSYIPKWFLNSSNLEYLNLGSCNFQGPIPHGARSLSSLKTLAISYNNLTSSLPKWLFGLNNLILLDLDENSLEGPIPCGFQNMTSLKHLSLSSNHFGPGTLPDSVYHFSHLETLNLEGNNFGGVLSRAIGNLTSIIELDWSHNALEGKLPSSMGTLCNLVDIDLSNNKFGGLISEAFESLSAGCLLNSLKSLSLSRNFFSGQITNQIAEFKTPEESPLSGNLLNGSFSESLICLPNLETLDISSNFLRGVVTEVHFASLTNLRALIASKNSLALRVGHNWIPPPHLERIQLRSWNLGPQFPVWLKSLKFLGYIDLSQTGISDTIPSWFWNVISSSVYLNLSHNQIYGELPGMLTVNNVLMMIYLGSNNLSGSLPRISSYVAELDLSKNSFSGEISRLLCHPTGEPNRLTILHLGDNHLSGTIPDCWTKWPLLKVIKLSNNNLTGDIPSSIGSLHGLRSLHLRNNSLTGELPMSLQNCKTLIAVDLGVNELVGTIPTWVGISLSSPKILGLRSNNLSGQIPQELCHLTAL